MQEAAVDRSKLVEHLKAKQLVEALSERVRAESLPLDSVGADIGEHADQAEQGRCIRFGCVMYTHVLCGWLLSITRLHPDCCRRGNCRTKGSLGKIPVFALVCMHTFEVCIPVGGWLAGWMDGWMGVYLCICACIRFVCVCMCAFEHIYEFVYMRITYIHVTNILFHSLPLKEEDTTVIVSQRHSLPINTMSCTCLPSSPAAASIHTSFCA
jgi:hypothetical protein